MAQIHFRDPPVEALVELAEIFELAASEDGGVWNNLVS
jgi:hypothetical protein